MQNLLTEMPWKVLEVKCPNCGTYIEGFDWFVELWDKSKMGDDADSVREKLQAVVKYIMGSKLVPVVCPQYGCGAIFTYNTNTKETLLDELPQNIANIFLQNKDIIIATHRDRFGVPKKPVQTFKEYYQKNIYEIQHEKMAFGT